MTALDQIPPAGRPLASTRCGLFSSYQSKGETFDIMVVPRSIVWQVQQLANVTEKPLMFEADDGTFFLLATSAVYRERIEALIPCAGEGQGVLPL